MRTCKSQAKMDKTSFSACNKAVPADHDCFVDVCCRVRAIKKECSYLLVGWLVGWSLCLLVSDARVFWPLNH